MHDGQAFIPRKGYENIRSYQLDPTLVAWAMKITDKTPLLDSEEAQKYRQRYPDDNARRSPQSADRYSYNR
ncbi:hypothetical protein [Budvicia aquatica]|uniref:hypothetical protein n=1 Tax=Budvicia aquatica TaxID=82979 RepID=UPI001C3FD573|nr:hypothetical protein [Budvicia aquatica]